MNIMNNQGGIFLYSSAVSSNAEQIVIFSSLFFESSIWKKRFGTHKFNIYFYEAILRFVRVRREDVATHSHHTPNTSTLENTLNVVERNSFRVFISFNFFFAAQQNEQVWNHCTAQQPAKGVVNRWKYTEHRIFQDIFFLVKYGEHSLCQKKNKKKGAQ